MRAPLLSICGLTVRWKTWRSAGVGSQGGAAGDSRVDGTHEFLMKLIGYHKIRTEW